MMEDEEISACSTAGASTLSNTIIIIFPGIIPIIIICIRRKKMQSPNNKNNVNITGTIIAVTYIIASAVAEFALSLSGLFED